MIPIITTPRLMAVGGGAVAELPGMLRRFGLANPLIVTDPFIERSGHLERATAYLDRAGISWMVFSDTVADPTTAVVEAGALVEPQGRAGVASLTARLLLEGAAGFDGAALAER